MALKSLELDSRSERTGSRDDEVDCGVPSQISDMASLARGDGTRVENLTEVKSCRDTAGILRHLRYEGMVEG